MSDAFDRSIIESTAHRPWPMPSAPWLMTQSWNSLLFAHWRVDASQVRQIMGQTRTGSSKASNLSAAREGD
jgi:uncharacterized protein YqjF (DUF2071 family)